MAMNDQIDLGDYVDLMIRRWKIIVAMPILAVIAATLVSLATRPTYEATAIIALSPATLSVPTSNQAPPYYLMVDSPQRLPVTHSPAYYIDILRSSEVATKVAPAVTITSDSGDKSLIDITASGSDSKEVQATANMYVQVGAARIQQILLPSDADVVAAAEEYGRGRPGAGQVLKGELISTGST